MKKFKFLTKSREEPYPIGVLKVICDSIQRKIPIRNRVVTYLQDGCTKKLKITRLVFCVSCIEFHYEIRRNDTVDTFYFNIPRREFYELIGGIDEFYAFNYRENNAYDTI